MRVRNPWGDKNEWRGKWSDGDTSWELVGEEEKREMGLHYMHDGEFWIEFFTDFCREFEEVSICTLGPEFDKDGNVDAAKYMKIVYGEVRKYLIHKSQFNFYSSGLMARLLEDAGMISNSSPLILSSC